MNYDVLNSFSLISNYTHQNFLNEYIKTMSMKHRGYLVLTPFIQYQVCKGFLGYKNYLWIFPVQNAKLCKLMFLQECGYQSLASKFCSIELNQILWLEMLHCHTSCKLIILFYEFETTWRRGIILYAHIEYSLTIFYSLTVKWGYIVMASASALI